MLVCLQKLEVKYTERNIQMLPVVLYSLGRILKAAQVLLDLQGEDLIYKVASSPSI